MLNDESQEDVTLENNVEEVEETEEQEESEEESTDVEAELTKARAEAKKWEAIAKRKAKKADETVKTEPATPQVLDQELINLTYKNYLGGLGLTNSSVQDEAISLAKKMGMALSQLQNDPAIMEILKAKQKVAVTNNAMTKGTGGSALRKKDAEFLASKVANGGTLDNISGKDAVALLKKFKG